MGSLCTSAWTLRTAVYVGGWRRPTLSCITRRSTSSKGNGCFQAFCFPIFTMENAAASPAVKCFRFLCPHLPIIPFGKRIVEKRDSPASTRYIHFTDPPWRFWEPWNNVSLALRLLPPTLQSSRRTLHSRAYAALSCMPETPGASTTVQLPLLRTRQRFRCHWVSECVGS